MKNYKLKAMLLMAVLLCSVPAFAEEYVELNDLYYTLNNDGTAQVRSAKDGIITAVIPEKITYGGERLFRYEHRRRGFHTMQLYGIRYHSLLRYKY